MSYVPTAEDIAYFRSWAGGAWSLEPGDDALRRGSAVLRRLLVEGEIQNAWKHHGFTKSPLVTANLIDAEATAHLSPVHVISAGGPHIAELQIEGFHDDRPPRGYDPKAPFPVRQGCEVPLSTYVQSPAILVNGEPVSRREVIQYVAYERGGVHPISSRGRKRIEERVKKIQRIGAHIEIGGKELIYSELREIGRVIGESADLARLEEVILHSERADGEQLPAM